MPEKCPNCGETTHPCIAPGVFGDRDQHIQCQRCGWTSAIPGLRKRIADLHRAKALCEDEAGNLRRELQAEKDDRTADVGRPARTEAIAGPLEELLRRWGNISAAEIAVDDKPPTYCVWVRDDDVPLCLGEGLSLPEALQKALAAKENPHA